MSNDDLKKYYTYAIVGLGGAGCKILGRLSLHSFPAYLVTVDTDATSLCGVARKVDETFILDEEITFGLGSGADTEIGRMACLSKLDEFMCTIKPFSHLIFIAGLGGGTGSGGISLFASEAIKGGKHVICLVTMPFKFEGEVRSEIAEKTMLEMQSLQLPIIMHNNQDMMLEMIEDGRTYENAMGDYEQMIYKFIASLSYSDFDSEKWLKPKNLGEYVRSMPE